MTAGKSKDVYPNSAPPFPPNGRGKPVATMGEMGLRQCVASDAFGAFLLGVSW